ncbi:MAG: hypothetical protein ACRDLB_14395 [Actinomycetota bacterium]
MRNTLRVGAAALAVLMVGSVGAGARGTAKRSNVKRAKDATHYIAKVQRAKNGSFPGFSKIGSTADAVMALVAARRSPTSIDGGVRYLQDHVDDIDDLGEIAKTVLAHVAAGESTTIGERDLVQEIEAAQLETGQYGDGATNAGVYFHNLSVLALAAAGENPGPSAGAWLALAQCDDGGWQFNNPAGENDDEHCHDGSDTDFTRSDTNTTSLAIQALDIIPGNENLEHDPFDMFRALKDEEKGGWGFDWTFTLTDTVSTSLVLQAYATTDRPTPRGGIRALRALQYGRCKGSPFASTYVDENGDGSYTKRERTKPDPGSTYAGVLGLLTQPYPVPPQEVNKAAPAAVCSKR